MELREFRHIIIAVVLVASASAVAFVVFFAERRQQEQLRIEETAELDGVEIGAAEDNEGVEMTLYFCAPGAGGSNDPASLTEETRRLNAAESSQVMARQIVSEILKGAGGETPNPFPPDARVRQIYLLADGTAIVDLSAQTAQHFVGGISCEYYSLESITRSLIKNIPSIERVKFLVAGLDRPTFAGHVSIRDPFM